MNSKHPLASRTVQGLLVTGLAVFLPKLGFEVDQAGLAALTDEAFVVLGLVCPCTGASGQRGPSVSRPSLQAP